MAIYRLLTTRFGLHPSETLFVDDLEKNVDVAQSMGFHVVHFADREKGMPESGNLSGRVNKVYMI